VESAARLGTVCRLSASCPACGLEPPCDRCRRPPAVSGALLEALRSWRLGVAREHGVPAYVVFHDATLESIAALRPRTREQLRGVSGVGDRKLERYGDALLDIVRQSLA